MSNNRSSTIQAAYDSAPQSVQNTMRKTEQFGVDSSIKKQLDTPFTFNGGDMPPTTSYSSGGQSSNIQTGGFFGGSFFK